VNTGPYKISAELVGSDSGSSVISEKTVTVEPYVLPKFQVDIETDRTYYQPGEMVRGSLQADYFFGKPVSEAQVELVGYTFDVQRNDFISLQGQTNEDGNFEFEFQLPEYVAGSDLDGGRGRVYLQANLTDQAQHTEISNTSLPVAGSSLVIEAVPEGGRFHPGLENILYVLTSYPDGLPAETDLNITFYENGQTVQASTGSYGLAEVRFTPQNPYQQLSIQAGDAQGNGTQRDFYFEGEYAEETVLLRTDRPVYRVGDAMQLSILTSQPSGTVYLDIVREGQTVSTRSLEVTDGHSEAAVDLTTDLFGTLELHAYKITPYGSITRDTRLVVVDHADDLQVALSPSQETYRPGDTANLGIQVNGQDGQGVQSLLGLAIVDESVFALAEQDPGFAKLYFMLEQELLQPKYDLHGYSMTDLVSGLPEKDPDLITAVETTAEASLAAALAAPGALPFRMNASSAMQFVERAYQQQQEYFNILSKVLFGLLITLAVAVLVLSVVSLRRERRLGRGLALAGGLFLLLLLILAAWLPGNTWSNSWLYQWAGGWLILALVVVGLAGYITLIVIAWRRKDSLLGWSLLLLPLILLFGFFLVFAAYQSDLNVGNSTLIPLVVAVALLPLAYLLRFADFSLSGKTLPALASLALAVGLILGLFPLVVSTGSLSIGPELRLLTNQLDAVPPPMMAVEEAMPMAAMAPMPTEAPAAMDLQMPVEKEALEGASQSTSAAAAEPPRLRQYFPETMLWLPDAITNPDGSLLLDVPVADSITTWRISALASTQDGRLGSTTAPLRIFQDFFIDLDLPVALTVGDEIAVPVGVFNYLPEPQTVSLELEAEDWFELLDEPVKTIDIAAGDIGVVYFRVRARDFGRQPFQVTAIGSRLSDAIRKDVQVYPDGKPFDISRSDRLTPGTPVQETIPFPADTIAGTQALAVKIYPGVLSQVVEGLDSILRMPNGCFEQTSSTTYPNVLVLDYLKSTGQVSPEVQLKAEEYINLGYQRLATFEVDGGGFSLFGDAPADRMLTAYGLQEFADMSLVYEVDPALLERAAGWLLSQQQGDLPVTAYVTWSLVEAGYLDDTGTQKALQYLWESQSQAEDAYELALVANALVAADLESDGKITPAT
ncbi:MAG: putative rane protein, partial [Chloroflexi bacterium]|nr:putative rane protein [Chloroflexota bacterium]